MSTAVGPLLPIAAEPLADRVARERAGAVRLARVAGVGAAGAGVAVVAAGAVWALGDGRWLSGPAAAPALCWVTLGAFGAAGAAAAARRVRRATARDAVVRHVEAERALRAGALRVALEVGGAGTMGAFAAAQLAPALSPRADALAPAWRRELARGAAGGGVALAAGVALLVASARRWDDGAAALAHPVDAARGTLLAPLHFVGAPARTARGRAVQLTLDAPGRRRVALAWRVAGRGWETREAVPDARGRAAFAIGALDADLAAVATDGRARTDTLRVAVDDRAFVGGVRLHAVYPVYLGVPDAELPPSDTVRVPRGTVLELRAHASAPLARAALVAGGAAYAAARDGDSLAVRWTPGGAVRLAWDAVARDGGPVDVPEPFVVVAVPDAAPVAAAALRTAAYDGASPVAVAVTASDDHGLASVRLHVLRRGADGREAAAGAPAVLLAAGAGITAAWSGTATVDPARLGIGPGETAVVRVEAVDASPWAQRGWSAPLVLSAPTVTALRTAARATSDSALAGVAAALTAARDLQQRTAEAARSRAFAGAAGSSPTSRAAGSDAERAAAARGEAAAGSPPNAAGAPLGYEAAERARALAAQQRQLASTVAAARAQTEALERRLQQAGALDTALARQLADARRMLREALTPELEAKLGAMAQGGAGMSASQTRETLEQLAEAQRALRERLERTADVLRRAALEGAMQTLGDEAREVAAAEARAVPRAGQESAASRAERTAGESPAQTAARATAVRDAIDSLRARLNREQAAAGATAAAQANSHAARSAQAMQRAAAQASAKASGAPKGASQPGSNQPGSNQPGANQSGASPSGAQDGGDGGAEASAQAASAEMRAAADALAKGRAAQIDAWKTALGAELDRAASETAQLAREQAAVREAARSGADPAGARSAEAAVRDGVEQTARRLAQAGRTSALLSERTRRAMDEARQQVGAAARALERQGGAQGGQPGGGSPGGEPPSGSASGASPSGGGSPSGSTPGGELGRGGAPRGGGRNPDAAMADAQDALARAAGALVRDRARVRDAASAAGAEDVLAEFRAAAGQQARLNAQSLGLPQPGSGSAGAEGKTGRGAKPGEGQGAARVPGQGSGGRDGARRLADQQRAIADRLEQLGDGDPSGRSDELAREARTLAAALDREAAGGAARDAATLARQQQLYRKLLEAGQSLERDEQDDQGPRQARAGVTVGDGAPADGATRGRSATRVAPPTWNELRTLPPEERRLVLEYFRRLNAAP